MGIVHRAEHVQTGTPAAIKFVLERESDRDYLAAFEEEARAVGRLSHPGVVALFDYGRLDAGDPYLVMELADRTLHGHAFGGWGELRFALLQLLDALAHVHARRLVHMDLKPSNVLVKGASQGSLLGARLRLSDFGVAYRSGTGSASGSAGTPSYMAPEQLLGQVTQIGPWTDLYALGCIAYEAACGRPPFARTSRSQLAAAHMGHPRPQVVGQFALPAEFQRWLHTLLAIQARERFQDAAHAAFALTTLGHESGESSPVAVPVAEFATLTSIASSSLAPSIELVVASSAGDVCWSTWPRPPVPDDWRPPNSWIPPLETLAVGAGLLGIRPAPYVGRVPARSQLWSAFRQSLLTSRPGCVVLSGGAGYGKSRLAQWLVERVEEVGAARTMSAFHTRAGGAQDGAVGMLLNELGSERSAVARQSAVGASDQPQRLLEVLFPSGVARAADPDGDTQAVTSLLAQIAKERPLVVWLDDVQWGPGALRIAIDGLRAIRASILFVVTVRTEGLADRPTESALLKILEGTKGYEPLEVGPLTPGERRELATRLLGVGTRVADQLSIQTGGHPLLMLKLLEQWVDTGRLVPTRSGYSLRGVASEPMDVAQVWRVQLETTLAGAALDSVVALELAATLSRTPDVGEWERLTLDAGVRLTGAVLRRLVHRGVLIEVDGKVRFTHEMARDAVVEHARQAGRYETHCARCASVIESLYPPGYPGRAERLGRHLLEARQFAPAMSPLGDGAMERFHRTEFAASGALLTMQEEAMLGAGLTQDTPIWRGLLVLRIRNANMAGDIRAAQQAADRLLDAEPYPDDEATAWAMYARGFVERFGGDLADAGRWYEQAGARFEALGHHVGAGCCQLGLSGVARGAGDAGLAIHCVETAITHFEVCNDLRGLGACHAGLATSFRLNGDHEACLRHVKAVLSICEVQDHPFDRVRVYLQRAGLWADLGRLDDAELHYQECLRLAERHALHWEVARAHLGLARVALETSKAEQAWSRIAAVQDTADKIADLRRRRLMSLMAWAILQRDWTLFGTASDDLGIVAAHADPDEAALQRLVVRLLAEAGQSARWD